jgi:hypothetical protein
MSAVIETAMEYLTEQSTSDDEAFFASVAISAALYLGLKKKARRKAMQKIDRVLKEMNL